VADGYGTVKDYVENSPELLAIAQKTINFLNGFYSDFALELLSSIDYIANQQKTFEKQVISQKLDEWSTRKHSMFSNPKYIDLSMKHLQNSAYL
jgi:hypothetical protein